MSKKVNWNFGLLDTEDAKLTRAGLLAKNVLAKIIDREGLTEATTKPAVKASTMPYNVPRTVKPLATLQSVPELSRAELEAKQAATVKAGRELLVASFGSVKTGSVNADNISATLERLAFESYCCDLLGVDPVKAGEKHNRFPREKIAVQVGFTRDIVKAELTKRQIPFTPSKNKNDW